MTIYCICFLLRGDREDSSSNVDIGGGGRGMEDERWRVVNERNNGRKEERRRDR